MRNEEIVRLQAYLQDKFELATLQVRRRAQKDDSCEVYIGDEFIGVIFKDDEDGDDSYMFEMAILDFDLPTQ